MIGGNDVISMSEQRALLQVKSIHEELDLLRENRAVYIRSEDVVRLYNDLSGEIGACEHHERSDHDETENCEKRQVLHRHTEECLLLISLFFMTIGRNSEPPAIYAPSIVIKQLIQHLTESGNFSTKDIEPIEKALEELKSNLDTGRDSHPTEVINYLKATLLECFEMLVPLRDRLKELPRELAHIHEKLVSIRRSIKGCEAKGTFSIAEVQNYKQELATIESMKIDGKFVGPDGAELLHQDMVLELLQKCHDTADEALTRQGRIAPSLRPIAEKLFRLRSHLERLSVTQAWSLRETDLFDFLKEVQEIDERRVNKKFVDNDGMAPEDGQSVLLYLLRRCYVYIFTLIISGNPVSEALTPIYNQLQTVRRCLFEVQSPGVVTSMRDLYPYSMKLASIDNLRVDGKFMVGSDIPEGQDCVNSLLAECFKILDKLRSQLKEE